MTLRFGWFTTARGAGSRAMYEAVAGAVARGAIDGEFAFVFCNRERGEDATTDAFFDLVEANGHPLVTLSSVRYRRSVGGERSRPGAPLPPWRREYDRLVERALVARPFELGMLAGYMLILGAEFVERHALLNLHPALPGGPRGTWREVIRQLIRDRAEESGVMLHLAIPAVDMGPAVSYCRYPLRDEALAPLWAALERQPPADDAALEQTALFAAIRRRGVQHEAPLLLATIDEFASGRLRVEAGRIVDADGGPAPVSDVTATVRAAIVAMSSPARHDHA